MAFRSSDNVKDSESSEGSTDRPEPRSLSLQLDNLSHSLRQWFINDPAFPHDNILSWFEHSLDRYLTFNPEDEEIRNLKEGFDDFRDVWSDIEEIRSYDFASSNFENEIDEICYRLKQKNLPEPVVEDINMILEESDESLERSDRRLVDTFLDLPWTKTDPPTDWTVDQVANQLNSSHYGLDELKNRILQLLAVIKRAPESSTLRLCLVGPPGTGKTTIARTIADAINRDFIRLSLGGLRDETEIIGLKRSWKNSEPGQLVKRLKETETLCPLILLDEVDKLSSTPQRDPTGAILQLLDPEQNSNFQDNYLEHGLDVSKALFVATANDRDAIPDPLEDRLEFIEFDGYDREEKLEIAKSYILPYVRDELNLQEGELEFHGDALRELVDRFTSSPGIRELNNRLLHLAREAIRVEGSLDVRSSNLNNLLSDEASTTRIGF